MMSNKELTFALFESQKHYICDKLFLDTEEYYRLMWLIVDMMGYYDTKKTYAGPGEGIGDFIVPDLCFSFAAYCHDGLCKAIETEADKTLTAAIANDYFLYSMKNKCNCCHDKGDECKGLAELYYKAVKNLGGSYKKGDTFWSRLKNKLMFWRK